MAGPELIWGFARGGPAPPYAELICEVVRSDGVWLFGAPRALEPGSPFPSPSGVEASDWLASPAAES